MRIKRPFFFIVLAVILGKGCTSGADEQPRTLGNAPYFSLEAYFGEEVERLQRQAPTVRKTVMKDEESEERELTISNWANELELFSLSDINMDAWIGKYEVDSTANRVEYRATDPELRTRRIVITRSDDGSIRHIQIANEATNMLYASTEQLDYYPDSLYVIEKHQDIRWWSNHTYTIKGHILAE